MAVAHGDKACALHLLRADPSVLGPARTTVTVRGGSRGWWCKSLHVVRVCKDVTWPPCAPVAFICRSHSNAHPGCHRDEGEGPWAVETHGAAGRGVAGTRGGGKSCGDGEARVWCPRVSWATRDSGPWTEGAWLGPGPAATLARVEPVSSVMPRPSPGQAFAPRYFRQLEGPTTGFSVPETQA